MEANQHNNQDTKRGDQLPPLPPELDWSNMKAGIFDKMQSIEQAELSQENGAEKKSRWLFLALFLALAIAFTAGLVGLFQADTTNQAVLASGIPPAPKAEANERETVNHDVSDPVPQGVGPEVSGGASADTANSMGSLPANEAASSGQAPARLPGAEAGQDVLSASLTLKEEQRTATLPASIPVAASPRPADTASVALLPMSARTSSWVERPQAKAWILLRNDQPASSAADYISSDSAAAPDAAAPIIPSTQPVNQVGLEGGLNFWTEGYGTTNPDRARYEAPIPSFQLQGYFQKGLAGEYFILVGLQYQQLESKLAYNNTIDDYQIFLEDTVLQVRRNPLTGEETIVRGDAIQTVQAERRVIHYNKTRLLKTSLAVGKSWRFHSWQADVYLGGALNGIVRNQGRMFFDNEIVDYSGTSNLAFDNQWTVHVVAGARVHYFPVQKVGITTGLQAQRSLMNWSTPPDGRMYPGSVGLQIGVSYQL